MTRVILKVGSTIVCANAWSSEHQNVARTSAVALDGTTYYQVFNTSKTITVEGIATSAEMTALKTAERNGSLIACYANSTKLYEGYITAFEVEEQNRGTYEKFGMELIV